MSGDGGGVSRYCLFGEVFEEAIRGGTVAVQTLHPGYYFQQAAKHTFDRKTACASLCQVTQLTYLLQVHKRPGKLEFECCPRLPG